ncbi:MAG: YkgJ family cysteine cluster protein [Sedimentisphaerales bacterium]|nr:YkgJ family cysteine cluster protein [Sedimentisphaerales bacterium]
MAKRKRNPWYVDGLHFECQGCGRCCSGPGEGYIWVTRPEIKLIAEFLEIPTGELKRDYLKRVGLRTSIIEDTLTKDCIFLRETHGPAGIDGRKQCAIYAVRPSQCRSWPFWPSNLVSGKAWNEATRKCPGVNRGRPYDCGQIDRIKKSRKWWNEKN